MTLLPIIQLYSVVPKEHSSALLLLEEDHLIKRNRALQQKVHFALLIWTSFKAKIVHQGVSTDSNISAGGKHRL